MSTMLTDTRRILAVIFTLMVTISISGVDSSKVLTLSDESDDENTLRQALYLVKLLKTDYMKSLRENSELDVNATDDANSTCREDEYNSTTTISLSSVTESGPQTVWTQLAVTPPAPTYSIAVPPPPPALVVAASPPAYPPQPMIQYTPPGIMPPAPAENYKYPYRYFQRRMMPEYGYYDVLLPRYKSQRRSSEANQKLVYAETAVPGLHRRFYYNNAFNEPYYENNFQIPENFRRQGYYDPKSNEMIIATGYRRVGDADPITSESAATVTEAATVPNQTNVSGSTSPMATTLIAKETIQTPLATQITETTPISLSPITTTITNKVHTKNVPTSRGTTKTTKVHLKFTKKVKTSHSRRSMSTTERKPTGEDVIISQVASELITEIKGSKTENTTAILRHNTPFRRKQNPLSPKSTMKIYLQGSSRIQIPFPENNAFCHLYPQNILCGAGI